MVGRTSEWLGYKVSLSSQIMIYTLAFETLVLQLTRSVMFHSIRRLTKQKMEPSPFLPKITMVGISTGEAGQMSKANLKKTMEDLTKELERNDHGNGSNPDGSTSDDDESKVEERDPLFVANVGDYYSGLSKSGSTRWVRGRGN